MTQHTIQIELEGLISLLAQNLYADPDVFLREMIQNAHDSISKRSALAKERGETDLPAGEIRILPDADARTLTIVDNGSGLTEEEVHSYLSTIGRSGTRELKEQLAQGSRRIAVELIGQFGIGLLSAFIVADRVEVITRSALEGALRWVSSGGKSYVVEPGEREEIGTTVVLHLRSDHRRYLEADRLRSIIRTYADFIGLPIFLGREDEPTNAVNAPWHRGYTSEKERVEAYHQYWEGRFKNEVSLAVLPIDVSFEFSDPGDASGVHTGRAQGVLGITDRRVPDVNSRGTVDVYISRMFVSQGNREILPTWARFIQGVIESGALTPNAARDNVMRNGALQALQVKLGQVIIDHLQQLSVSEPKRFVEIMRWHSYHILAMCVQDEHEAFFRAVADLVMLETDQGPMSVRDYLQAAPRLPNGRQMVYFIAERGSTNQYYLLCSARGIRVFNASEPFAERFLQRYAETWPDRIHLSRLDVTGSETIFEPIANEADRERFRDLETAYLQVFPDMRCIARVSRFLPREVPALITETRDAKSRREMETVSDNVALPRFIRDLVKNFLDERRDPLTLHLNADNAVIQRLAARSSLRDQLAINALVALYNNALMLLSRAIKPDDVRMMFEQYNQVIGLMLTSAEERDRLMAERQALITQAQEHDGARSEQGLTAYVTCFVAMPFRAETRAVYEAIEAVLEDVPFLWNVARADEHAVEAGLWSNVKRQMLGAHCFIAEISDQNANVMIEIGRMEAIGRPILLLKKKGSPDVPADLSGLLYVEYEAEGKGPLIEELREKIARHETFCRQQGSRYLSPIPLRRLELVSPQVCDRLAEMFKSVDDLLAADPKNVAERLNISAFIVQGVQDEMSKVLRRFEPGP